MVLIGSLVMALSMGAFDPTVDGGGNDTFATAQNVAPGHVFDIIPGIVPGVDIPRVLGQMEPGDVDYYRIDTLHGLPAHILMSFSVDEGEPQPSSVPQVLLLDGDTGLVIDFNVDYLALLQFDGSGLGGLTGPQSFVLAVSAGNDLDPALSNPASPLNPSPIAGSVAVFDGLDFQTGAPHQTSFAYSFQVQFLPAPTTASLLALGVMGRVRHRKR